MVLGTEGATTSKAISDELANFAAARGTSRIVPISFDKDAENETDWKPAGWYSQVAGLPRERENNEALRTGSVSPAVISRIEKQFAYTKSKDRLRKYRNRALGTFVFLMIASLFAGGFAIYQSRQAVKANAAAVEATTRAGKDIQQAQETAQSRIRQAEEDAQSRIAQIQAAATEAEKAANKRIDDARRTQQAAEAAAVSSRKAAKIAGDNAARQQQIASSFQLSNHAEQMRSAQADQLETSVVLAREALVRLKNLNVTSAEADQALRRGLRLLRSPVSHSAYSNLERPFITLLALSPDGRHLVTVDRSTSLHGLDIWEVGKPGGIHVPVKDTDVRAVAFEKEGKYLATVNGYGFVSTWTNWNTATPTETTRQFEITYDAENATAFSPDGRHLLARTRTDNFLLIKLPSFESVPLPIPPVPMSKPGYNHRILALAVNNDATLIAVAYSDGSVRTWNPTTLKPVSTIVVFPEQDSTREDRQRVTALAFDNAGRRLAIAATDNLARVWAIDTGQQIAAFAQDAEIDCVKFSPDDRYLATAGQDNTARIWSLDQRTEVVRVAHNWWVDNLAFSADGRFFATGNSRAREEPGNSSRVRIWKFAENAEDLPIVAFKSAKYVYLSPQGRYFASVYDQTVKVWLTNTRSEVLSMEARFSAEAWEPISFSPNDRYIAIRVDDGQRKIVDLTTRQVVSQVNADKVVFSSDGEVYAAVRHTHTGEIEDRTVFVFKTAGGLLSSVPSGAKVSPFAPSKGGSYLAVTDANNLHVWKLGPSPQEVWSAGDVGNTYELSWINENKIALLSVQGQLKLFDLPGKRLIEQVGCDGPTTNFSVDPGGHYLGFASARSVCVIELGKASLTKITPDSAPRRLFFDPERKYIGVLQQNNTVSVYDQLTTQPVAKIKLQDFVDSAAFDETGRYIVTSSSKDLSARSWLWDPQQIIADSCNRVSRPLNENEWQQYGIDGKPAAVCPR